MSNKIKILWVTALSIFCTSFLMFEYFDEQLPEGVQGEKADLLAHRMLNSINDSAWLETGAISWGYDDRTYIWDKKRHFAQVNYKSYQVLLDINNRKGFLTLGGAKLSEEKKKEIYLQAWKYWGNDSFWLNPISKIFDPGTERRLVKWKGEEALLITYTSGGSTPGDSYLWIVDENDRPNTWKLWVSIIPIGGLQFTWENWVQLETGIWVSTSHYNPIKTIPLVNPIAKYELQDLIGEDIFAPLHISDSILNSF